MNMSKSFLVLFCKKEHFLADRKKVFFFGKKKQKTFGHKVVA